MDGPSPEPQEPSSSFLWCHLVIGGIARICSIITGGNRAMDVSHGTFVTFIKFLLERLRSFGVETDRFPLATDLLSDLERRVKPQMSGMGDDN